MAMQEIGIAAWRRAGRSRSVAACRWVHDSRRHHPGAGRENMNGTLPRKFHEAFCGGQFGTERVPIRKTLGAHNDYTGAILHFEAADSPVGFPLERIREA